MPRIDATAAPCRRTRRARPEHAGTDRDQLRIRERMAAKAAMWRRDPALGPGPKVFGDALADLTLENWGDGRIGVPKLARRLGRSERTIRRYARALEVAGYLEIGERVDRHGGPAVNCYRLRIPRDRGAEARLARAEARRERDRVRKERRAARFARRQAEPEGGVLTKVSAPPSRGRESVLRTAEVNGRRPPVPAGRGGQRGGVVVMPERFSELGPTWGGGSRDADASPGRGRVDEAARARVMADPPELTEDQLTAAARRGSPIRLEDVVEARIRGRLAPADEGLTNAEIARYNARAAATWERERAGRPRPRPRPRHRR